MQFISVEVSKTIENKNLIKTYYTNITRIKMTDVK